MKQILSTTKKSIIILFIIIILSSCHYSTYVEITTKKEITSYCDNSYDADVCVWVRNSDISINQHSILEYYNHAINVTEDSANKFIQYYMKEAIKKKQEVECCIKYRKQ
jgi:hypothetical protein